MKPDVPSALNELARVLSAEVVPALPPSALVGELSLWVTSLRILAERWDSFVADLTKEIDQFEVLIERASTLPCCSQLGLDAIVHARTESLLVSELETRRAILLNALTNLQIAMEERKSDPDESAVAAEIWRALAAGAKQERVAASPF